MKKWQESCFAIMAVIIILSVPAIVQGISIIFDGDDMIYEFQIIDREYAEMWNYSSNATAWTFHVDAANVYYNLTNLNNAVIVNGFITTNNNQTHGGSYVTTQIAGTYKVDFSLSFEATQSNALYGIAAVKNFDVNTNRQCYSRRLGVKNAAGNVADSCIMSLDVGDTVNMQIENEETNRDIKVHTANFNLVRIGNI